MILPFATIGLVLSIYSVWVLNNLSDKSYKPWCDLAENISCSKALKVLPNPIYGIIYYVGVLGLLMYAPLFLPVLTILGAVLTFYLMQAVYQHKNFCVISTLIFIINFALAYYSF